MERLAFDLVPSEDGRNYDIVIISYNLETGDVKINNTTYLADSLAVATYKCKEIITKKAMKMEEMLNGYRKKNE